MAMMKLKYRLICLMCGSMMLSCASKTTVPVKAGVPKEERHIPAILNAEAKCEKIGDKIEGNRWEEAHEVCVITKGATWSIK